MGSSFVALPVLKMLSNQTGLRQLIRDQIVRRFDWLKFEPI